MSAILLRGGCVVDPGCGLNDLGDVFIEGGLVTQMTYSGRAGELDQLAKDTGAQVIDCAGLTIAPGLIDMHVHLREPGQTHKETIATGTLAAVAGGVTTVVAMPNTVPVTDTVEWLQFVQSPARGSSARVLAMPAATVGSMGGELTDYAALAAAGAIGFTDDGKPVLADSMMEQALIASARLGLPISQHAEDTRMTVGASMNFGPVAFRLGLRGMPIEAESSIVDRDIALLEKIEREHKLKPHLHVQHVSTAKALESIRAARQRGLHVTCEVAPHHIAFTDEAIAGDEAQRSRRYDTHFKMNPPLRAASDRDACIAAILDGTVDVIATDHAPHAEHEKNVEFERAPNGITGLETALGASLRILHGEHGMPLLKVLALFTSAPAEKFRLRDLGHDVGRIAVGAPADLVVFDAAQQWSYDVATTRSKSKNTPFHGAPMLGRVSVTIVNGAVRFSA
ncbi:dihydroorotase [Terriglobus roseus]|uniref:Dihydroorotase n=1 Tax=Terriglobus roseus TaxID=392734 RepID=A0A1H4PE92_9BACT|nr:dihydroorotase [Terriglobus roseus]SEC05332.1 dihydroorotase [Terriglobus roseus]